MQLGAGSSSTSRFQPLQTCLVALLVLAGAASAWADNYPSRPIRIVVPTQAGAAQDI
jgi:tripartite-type tricarboxylate transporter receptor subunit TctC